MVAKLLGLFIPRKTQKPVQQPDYGTDMRVIEAWAKQLIAFINTLPTSPGITDITTLSGSIRILNPTGPTVNLDVSGYPFLNNAGQFCDANNNVGYSSGVFDGLSGLPNPMVNNTAIGFQALSSLGTGGSTGATNVAVGSSALSGLTTGSANVAVGTNALLHCNSSNNTGIGGSAGAAITSGGNNTYIGTGAGGVTTTGGGNTAVGESAGPTAAGLSNTTSIGFGVTTTHAGGVAIGIDHTGTSSIANNQDDFVLGTNLHVVNFLNSTTGSTTTNLGTNSPAVTATPAGWIKIRDNTGAIGYIPYWK